MGTMEACRGDRGYCTRWPICGAECGVGLDVVTEQPKFDKAAWETMHFKGCTCKACVVTEQPKPAPCEAIDGCPGFPYCQGSICPYASQGVDSKPTNPKDAVGVAKVPWSTIPLPVLGEVGLAMMEGARKYGRHNYRAAGVRASVYFDAVVARHLAGWWEGEDMDAESGLSHVTKAIAGLIVLRDSMMQGNWVDDRPPPSKPGWLAGQNAVAASIIEKYPDAMPAHTAEKK